MPQLVWFITSCSSGFGEQFVYSILERGDKVIASGRTLEQLKHLEDTGADALQLNLTYSELTIRETIAEAVGIYGRIDFLVNNASYVAIEMWEDLE